MLYVTVILFQVGIVASVVLGIVCAVLRILVACRTRRWVSAIEHDEATQALSSSIPLSARHPGRVDVPVRSQDERVWAALEVSASARPW